MRSRRRIVITACTALVLALPAQAATAARMPAVGRAAPYEYMGWGSPEPPAKVMAATGVRAFTFAFMLSDGTCHPAWDGQRPLLGGIDQAAIRAVRAAGGSVVVSFGGWSGKKLGVVCHTAAGLAAAYEAVIDTYHLKAIDIDIEHTEVASAAVRQRVITALTMVRRHESRPIAIYMTFGVTPSGPDAVGRDLIRRAAGAHLRVTGWTIMPFDFGAPEPDMGAVSVRAAEGTKRALMAAYHEGPVAAYRTLGISSMNGRTDERDETVTLHDFATMLAYARLHHLARFTFWSVNRDRSCSGAGPDACSGIRQRRFAFTRVIASYHG